MTQLHCSENQHDHHRFARRMIPSLADKTLRERIMILQKRYCGCGHLFDMSDVMCVACLEQHVAQRLVAAMRFQGLLADVEYEEEGETIRYYMFVR